MGSLSNNGTSQTTPYKFLIYGKTSWIGGLIGKICESQNINYTYDSGRLESHDSLVADLEAVKPTHVFNAACVNGRPNVDWCESHKFKTIRTNVVGILTLADVCREKGLALVNYATGCIFEYDEGHLLGSGVGFKEEDSANFVGFLHLDLNSRLESRDSLVADLEAVKPTHVFNAACVNGRPNVDWCESHKVKTIRTNVVGTLTLADVCREKGLVLVNYATGCIF
nr:bifunctional dTDP-4-dehydrorhamnose 3,5-epimerase/dTDP-4-dehydrorhamnose reductase [Tanacetum cinerariifolium]